MLLPQQNQIRSMFNLNGIWDFTPDPDKIGEDEGWYNNLPESIGIAVPGSWNDQLSSNNGAGIDIHSYLGTVWYRKDFFVPVEWKQKRVWIRIGAAYHSIKIWVNGSYIGSYECGFLPVEFEITDFAKAGKNNIVSIQVNNELREDTLPQDRDYHYPMYPKSTFDWYPYSGIHRPVIIYSTEKSIIKDIKTETSIEGNLGIIDYSIDIEGDVDSLNITIIGNGFVGKESISAGGTGRVVVEDASFWSPESPALYDFTVELVKNGNVIDQYILPIGIRTVKVIGDELLLNGKPIRLQGVCKHEDFPVTGKGFSYPVMVKDFSLIKWLGANCIRCSHYPYAEEWLYMADREGILVVDEAPAYHLDYRYLNNGLYKTHKRIIKEMIERDRNHPSVIIWCVANEPNVAVTQDDYPLDSIIEYFKNICEYTKGLDDRPVTLASSFRQDWGILQFCDIAFLNRYFGWYEHTGQIKEGNKALLEDHAKFHDHLHMPIVLSEFGADCMVGLHDENDAMWTEEFQAKFLCKTIETVRTLPYVVGELVWCFADFRVSQSHMRVMNNRKGIFTRERTPKLSAHMVRSIWRGKD